MNVPRVEVVELASLSDLTVVPNADQVVLNPREAGKKASRQGTRHHETSRRETSSNENMHGG